MKRIYILFIAAVLIIPFFMTSCDKELDTPPIATVDQSKVLTIADIYKIKADSSFEYMFKDDYMLYATVTMDDAEGNIYKEAYVEDSTGGINIYKLSYAKSIKVGQHIRINLNRARVVDYSGKLELVFDSILNTNKSIVVQHSNNPIIPEPVTIADIETGNYKCKLVEVQGIQFANSELNETFFGNVTFTADNRVAEDGTKTIKVRTRKYADFAKDTVPQGSGKMVAIVTLHSTGWQLLVRSIDEVDMNGPRF